MKFQALALAAMMGVSGSAVAADVSSSEAFNWTGGYVGAQIGYSASGAAEYYLEERTWNDDYDYDKTLRGLLGGVYVGYNHQFDNGVVLGGEADVTFSDIHASLLAPGDWAYEATTKIDRAAAARVRLGVAVDRFMPYIAGGISYARLNFHETNGVNSGSADANLFGWNLGVGGEYAVTDNLVLRAEYRYTKYNNKSLSVDGTASDYAYDVKSNTNEFRVGIAYKF